MKISHIDLGETPYTTRPDGGRDRSCFPPNVQKSSELTWYILNLYRAMH